MQAGILDTMNISPIVSNQLYKYKSIDLCLNKSHKFGKDFLEKYEKGLNQNIDKIINLKNVLIKDLEKDGRYEFRDIDGKI